MSTNGMPRVYRLNMNMSRASAICLVLTYIRLICRICRSGMARFGVVPTVVHEFLNGSRSVVAPSLTALLYMAFNVLM